MGGLLPSKGRPGRGGLRPKETSTRGTRGHGCEVWPVNRRANGTPDRRAKGTPCLVTNVGCSARPGGAGRVCAAGASASYGGAVFGRSGAVLEAPALVAGLDDVAVMGEAVETEADELLVSVHDSGPGLAPDVQDNLFKPFITTKARPGARPLDLPLDCRIPRRTVVGERQRAPRSRLPIHVAVQPGRCIARMILAQRRTSKTANAKDRSRVSQNRRHPTDSHGCGASASAGPARSAACHAAQPCPIV